MRCYHEASLHTDNCFITLTYDEHNLPDDSSLNKRHFQLFMKRLRKKFPHTKIRYYHCGEYGENFGRPHYHACLFGFDFADAKPFGGPKNGNQLYTSATLQTLWPFGLSSIGRVTFASAAYVARYIMKKINGDLADHHYFDPITGVFKQPEYTTMSRRPGIARDWLTKYMHETYPDDFCVINGKKVKPPKFYDTQFELLYPAEYGKVRAARKAASRLHVDNNTPERLKVREAVANARLSQMPRKLK